MYKFWLVCGYWKDDNSEFLDYRISESRDVDPETDDTVFMYGMDEDEIKQSMNPDNEGFEFVITQYAEE